MNAEKNNAPPLDVSAPSGQADLAAMGGSETILLAEDDARLQRLAESTLRAAGYAVLAAKDGEEALQLFEEYADDIDMAIFDVVMPRMGGIEAMEAVLKRRPELPHFFVSGYACKEAYAKFAKDKHLPILDKPYPAEALLRRVREEFDRK